MRLACVLPGPPTGLALRHCPAPHPARPHPPRRVSPPLFRPLNWTRGPGPGHLTPVPPGGAGQESCSALEFCLHPSPAGAAACVIICSLWLSGTPKLRDSQGAKAGRGVSPCPAGQGPRGRPLQALGGLLSALSTRPSLWLTAGLTRTVPRGRRGRTATVSRPALQGLPTLGGSGPGDPGWCASVLHVSLPPPTPAQAP